MKGGQTLTELSVPIGLLLAEKAVSSLNKKTKKVTKKPAKETSNRKKSTTVRVKKVAALEGGNDNNVDPVANSNVVGSANASSLDAICDMTGGKHCYKNRPKSDSKKKPKKKSKSMYGGMHCKNGHDKSKVKPKPKEKKSTKKPTKK